MSDINQEYLASSSSFRWFLRFPGIIIPRGKQIPQAKLTFSGGYSSSQSGAENLYIKIHGHKIANAVAPTTTEEFIEMTSNLTSSSRVISNLYMPIGQEISFYGFEDIVKEITYLPDWESGNAIMFMVSGVTIPGGAPCFGYWKGFGPFPDENTMAKFFLIWEEW